MLPGADSTPQPSLNVAGHAPEAMSALPADSGGSVNPVGERVRAPDCQAAGGAATSAAASECGDQAALAAVVTGHRAAVYGYLRSRLLEPSDAEDLCQEVFLRFYQGRTRFQSLTPGAVAGESGSQPDAVMLLRAWLIGIARNLLHEHVRRVKRRKEIAWTELCLQLESLIEHQDDRFDERMVHLPVCLQSLGQSARQALDLRYQAQLRLSEIGEKLHRSEGAIKLLMFRARQALKHCLDSKLEDRSP